VYGCVINSFLFGHDDVQGLTRLTGSGLSMVKWKPQGTLPPMTQAEWEAEFEEFKAYPEYQVIRARNMCVGRFAE
jgi:cytochrome c oxidase assembly protein subunit 15